MEVASKGCILGAALLGTPPAAFCCKPDAHPANQSAYCERRGAFGYQRVPGGSSSRGHWQEICLCAFKLKTTCQTKLPC